MFERNGRYANRKGEYTVIAINPPKMTVRYDNGSQAELNIEIQARIWDNIRAEHEPRRSSRPTRRRQLLPKVQHFIKAVNLPDEDEFMFPGWQEQVVLQGTDPSAQPQLKPGDRLIYYAPETRQFLAVVTIIGEATESEPSKYFYTLDAPTAIFLPVDVDATTLDPTDGIALESVELESQPNFGQKKPQPEEFISISEDDFELLAELLAEISEEEEDDLDFDEEDEEDEE